MKVKKIPMRTCVVTHEKYDKRDLLRIVKDNAGRVFVDDTGKANGRGAYLKKDLSVIEKAQKTKILEKHLEININDEIYEELKSKL